MSVSILFCTEVKANDRFDNLLLQADKQKAASKQIFDSTINQLQQHRDQLSAEQLDYLDYLLIYDQVYKGDYNQAATDLEALFKRVDSTIIKIRTQSSLSNLYAFNRNYQSVFTALQYVTDELPKIEDRNVKHGIYLAIANSYLLTNRFHLAHEFAEIIVKDNPEPFKRCRAMAYSQLADIELDNRDNISEASLSELISLCQSQKQYAVSDLLALRWYQYQFDQLPGDVVEADIKHLISKVDQTGLQINTQQFKSILTGKDALLAQLYLAVDDLNLAQYYAQLVVKDAGKLGESRHLQKAYQVLETIARRQDNFSLAYEYLSQRSDVERALMTDALDKQVAYAAVQHDLMAKEIQLQQLGQSNELLRTQQVLAAKESLNQKLIMAWLLFMVGILLLWVVRVIIKRKKLETLVEIDYLTKILNRKGLENHVNQLLSRKASQRQPVHLAIMDLDHFKKVNDDCGHLTGDWVLKYVIYHLKTVLADGMIIGRLGGEEFAVVGCGFDMETMLEYLEKMRRKVLQLDYDKAERPINLSASFGVAASDTAGYSLQMLLTQADIALYQAKNNGRNQVVVYQPDGSKIPTVPESPE